MSMARDGIARVLEGSGISVAPLEWTRDRSRNSRPLWQRATFKVRRTVGLEDRDVASAVAARAEAEIARAVTDADLAFFPWPYWVEPPRVSCAVAATIHDLNFKYFFGTQIFSTTDVALLDGQIGRWASNAASVASSEFMADEIAKHYPSAHSTSVIRLAPFASPDRNGSTPPSDEARRLGRYVLCGTHLTVHKNLGALIAAQAILRSRFPDVRLVITGAGTEAATGQSTAIGSFVTPSDPDVIGLGYVSNERIDALIAGAAVVVNPSLYEAGNGPGVDAWSFGTPVAMSDIPAFREHLPALGVQAALFDPRDPADIAAKISDVLEHPEEWSVRAAASKVAIGARSWDDVAKDYLSVFDRAFSDHARG